jgi:hypothetical protein
MKSNSFSSLGNYKDYSDQRAILKECIEILNSNEEINIQEKIPIFQERLSKAPPMAVGTIIAILGLLFLCFIFLIKICL